MRKLKIKGDKLICLLVCFAIGLFLIKVVAYRLKTVDEKISEEYLTTSKSDIDVDEEGNLVYIGPDIRILEIEPADSFKITNQKKINEETRVTTGKENLTYKDYKIEVTHMTMAQFIGSSEALNGKYDIITIGNYVDNNLRMANGNIFLYDYNEYENSGMWIRSYKALELTSDSMLDNDITDKKAYEIIDFANSGQLVYIENGVGSLNGSKLQKHINGDFKNSNILIRDNNDLTLENTVDKYIERIGENSKLKRPNIICSSPEGDGVYTSSDTKLGDISKRNMVFNIKSYENINENIAIKLYLDFNGDGLFKDEEIVKEINDVNIDNEYYKLEYNIYEEYPEFLGYLKWRVSVEKNCIDNYSMPIKSYFDGEIVFRRLTEEKRVINVLQISPYNSDIKSESSSYEEGSWDRDKYNEQINEGKGNLNLATNKAFQELINSVELSDYKINIDVINYKDFYSESNSGLLKTNLKNTKYNMIIMGFADMNPSELIGENGVEQLKEYVEANQSLMLTHDLLWYTRDNYSGNYGDNKYDIRNTSLFIKTFRDVFGQSRFKDVNNPSEKDFNGNVIVHDKDGKDTSTINPSSQDYIKEAGGTLLIGGDELKKIGEARSTQVYKVNESILTSYPFGLGEEIEVRRTHGQYFQLNLEDENVVPLFNLTEVNDGNSYSQNNRYDSKNFYYTYSRGNITFSGTGENTLDHREYPESEMKLFVNTIIKAERAGNHKPKISGLENIVEIPYNSDFNFNIVVKDVDGDMVKINKIIVNDIDITLSNNIKNEYRASGSQYPITITKDLLTKDKSITIKIEAEDNKLAKEVKEYIITPTANVIITPSTEVINTIVGDSKDFKIELEKINDTNPSSITIDKITLPNDIGVATLNDVRVEGDYLVGAITSKIKSFGERIPIVIEYRSSQISSKKVVVNIILNSKEANIDINIKSKDESVAKLYITPTILLNNKNNVIKTYEGIIKNNEKLYFNLVAGGSYDMNIDNIGRYKIVQVLVDKSEVEDINNINFDISYDNNNRSIEIIVEEELAKYLSHGLYNGIVNNKVEIKENTMINGLNNPLTLAGGSTLVMGSTFNTSSNNINLSLNIDDKFEQVKRADVIVYKVMNNNGIETLEPLEKSIESGYTVTEVDGVVNKFNISISGFNKNNEYTKVLIVYKGTIKDNISNESLINKIDFGSGIYNYFSININTNTEKLPRLPELF